MKIIKKVNDKLFDLNCKASGCDGKKDVEKKPYNGAYSHLNTEEGRRGRQSADNFSAGLGLIAIVGIVAYLIVIYK